MRGLLLFLVFLSTISAQAASYDVGPYAVKFDMGFPIDFDQIDTDQTESFSGTPRTEYWMFDPGLAIMIRNSTEPSHGISDFGEGSRVEDRVIDGHPGIAGMMYTPDDKKLIHFGAWRADRTTVCLVLSQYPWEDTAKLLRTINVTRKQ